MSQTPRGSPNGRRTREDARGRRSARRGLQVHHNSPDRSHRADDDVGDNGDQSHQKLGCSRCRRTDPADHARHRRTSGRECTVARHDRRRLRGPRDRQTARAPRPLVWTQGRSHELSEPQGTARGRLLVRLMLLTPQCDRAARACLR